MKLLLKNVRLSFPDLFSPRAFQGGEPAYSASFLMPHGGGVEAEVIAAIKAVAKDKWGDKAEATLKALKSGDKLCLHDGDNKEYDGYAGMSYVTARSKTRPVVIDGARRPLSEADGRPYAGCYVNASIDVWAQDNQYGKRICASLRGVQFVADGDAFTGSSPARPDEFPEIEEDVSDLF